MQTGGILALSFRQHRHRIQFCGYLLGQLPFFLSKPAQECSKFKQLLTTGGVQEFSGCFFLFWGVGRWVSTTRHSIGKLAVKFTHLFEWKICLLVAHAIYLLVDAKFHLWPQGEWWQDVEGRQSSAAFIRCTFGQQFPASVFECFLSYFPSLIFNNARKTELQNKMYSGFLNCENIDILSTPPPQRGSQAGIYQEKNVFQGERWFKVKLGINESAKWRTFHCQ